MSLAGVLRSLVERLIGYDLRKNWPSEPSPREEIAMRFSGVPEIDERVLKEYEATLKTNLIQKMKYNFYPVRIILARVTPAVMLGGSVLLKAVLPADRLEGFDLSDKCLIGGIAIHSLDYLIFDMLVPALRQRRSLQNVKVPDSY